MEALSPAFSTPTPYPTTSNDPYKSVNSLNRSIASSNPTPSILNNCLSKINSACNHVRNRGIQLVQEGTKSLVSYVVQQALTSPEFEIVAPGVRNAFSTALIIYQQINSAAGEDFVCDQSDNNTNIIDPSKRCDGQYDCQDKTDEKACSAEDYNKAGKFKCETNKKVIPLKKYCDGTEQCKDKSDESKCTDSDYSKNGFRRCPDGSVVKKNKPCPEASTTNQPSIYIEKTSTTKPGHFSSSITDQIFSTNTTTTVLPETTNSTLTQQGLLPANETGNSTEPWSVNSTESWSVNSTTAFPVDETTNPPDLSFPLTIGPYCAVVSLIAIGYLIYKTKAEVGRLQTEDSRPLSWRTVGHAFFNTITCGRCRQTTPTQEATDEESPVMVPLCNIEAEAEACETSAGPSTRSVETEAIEAQKEQPTKSEPAPTRLTAGMKADYEINSKSHPTPDFHPKGMRVKHGQPAEAGPVENRAGVRLPPGVLMTFEDTSF